MWKMNNEIWKDVIKYEGLYQVSNLGRVKKLSRSYTDTIGRTRFLEEKIIIPTKGKYYYVVNLNYNNKSNVCYIHHLVAKAFLNHTPNGFTLVIDHIDGNHLNNKLDNLQIITHRQNISKSKKHSNKTSTGTYKGYKEKWYACINIKGKTKHLGSFNTREEAKISYDTALLNLN